MGAGEQLNACDNCDGDGGRLGVHDCGLSTGPYALCGDCLDGVVAHWLRQRSHPLMTTSTIDLARGLGMDPRMLKRRLDVAGEDDTG